MYCLPSSNSILILIVLSSFHEIESDNILESLYPSLLYASNILSRSSLKLSSMYLDPFQNLPKNFLLVLLITALNLPSARASLPLKFIFLILIFDPLSIKIFIFTELMSDESTLVFILTLVFRNPLSVYFFRI